jgi:hypothetical protein
MRFIAAAVGLVAVGWSTFFAYLAWHAHQLFETSGRASSVGWSVMRAATSALFALLLIDYSRSRSSSVSTHRGLKDPPFLSAILFLLVLALYRELGGRVRPYAIASSIVVAIASIAGYAIRYKCGSSRG